MQLFFPPVPDTGRLAVAKCVFKATIGAHSNTIKRPTNTIKRPTAPAWSRLSRIKRPTNTIKRPTNTIKRPTAPALSCLSRISAWLPMLLLCPPRYSCSFLFFLPMLLLFFLPIFFAYAPALSLLARISAWLPDSDAVKSCKSRPHEVALTFEIFFFVLSRQSHECVNFFTTCNGLQWEFERAHVGYGTCPFPPLTLELDLYP